MNRLLVWVGVAIVIAKSPAPVAASLVDAGDIISVYASAPFFDTRLGDENGCDPAGCEAGLTRVSRPGSVSTRRDDCFSFDLLPEVVLVLPRGDESSTRFGSVLALHVCCPSTAHQS